MAVVCVDAADKWAWDSRGYIVRHLVGSMMDAQGVGGAHDHDDVPTTSAEGNAKPTRGIQHCC